MVASSGQFLRAPFQWLPHEVNPREKVALVVTGAIPRLFQRVIKGGTELSSDQTN